MPKELLFSVTRADLRIDTFRAGGKGGQNQNKVETGVRVVHVKSGAVGEARDTRSQLKNRTATYNRMVATPKFQAWLRTETARQLGQAADIEAVVDRMMQDVKVEYL
jgi:protein subunit release factor B